MDSPQHQIKDLLSGMLDGILSDQELRQLESYMAEDPSVQTQLDELSATRNALLSCRSKGRLGPDFAKNVTVLAKQRATAMGDLAPEWLVPASTVGTPSSLPMTPIDSIPFLKRAWVYSCVGIAAVAALIFVNFRPPIKQDLVSLNPKPAIHSGKIDLEIAESAEQLLAARPEKSDEKDPETNRSMAVNDEPIESTEMPILASNEPAESNVASSLATTEPANSTTASVEATASAEPKQSSKSGQKKSPTVRATLVMYVTIDPIAIQNRALETILEDRKIIYTDDLNITEAQMTSLVASQLIGAETEKDNGNMQALFLRSTAENLGSALEDIIHQYKDFPQCSMDIIIDKAVRQLEKQLSTIELATNASGFARRLAPPKGVGAGLPFTASVQRKGMFQRPELEKVPLSSVMQAERNEMSNVLLFVRPAR